MLNGQTPVPPDTYISNPHESHANVLYMLSKHAVIIIKTTWCEPISILDTTENRPNNMLVSMLSRQALHQKIHTYIASPPPKHHTDTHCRSMGTHKIESAAVLKCARHTASHGPKIRPTWSSCLTSLVEFDYERMLSIGIFNGNSYGPTIFQPIRMRTFLVCFDKSRRIR